MRSFVIKAAVAVVTAAALVVGGTATPASANQTSAFNCHATAGYPSVTENWSHLATGGWETFITDAPHTVGICIASDDLTTLSGYAILTTTSSTIHRLTVCNTSFSGFTARVNVADSAGNATSTVIAYTDPNENFGCLNRDLGYRIRKFRAAWPLDVFVSDWRAPAP
jgi:hypothetical protein